MSFSNPVNTRLDVLLREIDVSLAEKSLRYNYKVNLISTGTNIQKTSLYASSIQENIKSAISSTSIYNSRWVNHITGPLNESLNGFVFWDLETFCAATGLNYPTMWRRKANIEDDFSYGAMQQGDIIGPWVIEDIQTALGMMQIVLYSSFYELVGTFGKFPAWHDTKAQAIAGYNNSAWAWWDPIYGMQAYTDARWIGSGEDRKVRYACARYAPAIVAKRVEEADQRFANSGVVRVFVTGEASALGVFSQQGDEHIIQGADASRFYEVASKNYPQDWIEGESAYVVMASAANAPTEFAPDPEPGGIAKKGYKVAEKWIGETLVTAQFLFIPNFTYG